jgi:hypothetical protein
MFFVPVTPEALVTGSCKVEIRQNAIVPYVGLGTLG